ncbi:hypothetical protein AMECASPLE_002400 [Ameca splendens]|uniref:Uncharacterized protein n=1 Tax=Ameca splendens TaxID=208324 RepID=A0ABV1A5K0_9TELE
MPEHTVRNTSRLGKLLGPISGTANSERGLDVWAVLATRPRASCLKVGLWWDAAGVVVSQQEEAIGFPMWIGVAPTWF